ncbi:hypothetical protein NLJ89_g9397 [Agrocybe chaxingu]|uniref:Uncharacterized protein n=1 Tax=Agrocybe chaxingu TaxID=84603 RepID=A0A9W8JQW1_9AGAR|nr:hypothetical protein NLJ89_g9397 [Agrocybe chaxingu]
MEMEIVASELYVRKKETTRKNREGRVRWDPGAAKAALKVALKQDSVIRAMRRGRGLRGNQLIIVLTRALAEKSDTCHTPHLTARVFAAHGIKPYMGGIHVFPEGIDAPATYQPGWKEKGGRWKKSVFGDVNREDYEVF